MPRDVEAVEAVIAALDKGVSGDLEAHRVITSTLVQELELSYGAVWLPAADGSFRLAGEWGSLAPAMGKAGVDRLVPGTGLGGQALRSREPVHSDETTDRDACARWSAASGRGRAAVRSCRSSTPVWSWRSRSSTRRPASCRSSVCGGRSGTPWSGC